MVDQLRDEVPGWLDRESFPFRSRWLGTSFGRVHYVDEGPRDATEVVLLVHGTPSWSFEYRHVIMALAGSRRVVAFDHLGFGLSERPRDFAYTPEAHTQVLRELLAGLGLSRFSLVVHDFGGPIALPLAIESPERLSGLVVMNSWMWRLDDDPSSARSARFMASAVGRFLYGFFNASLRLLMPFAYADRRRLTARIHAQYLAPFRRREDRVRVLWRLACSLLASGESFGKLWAARERLSNVRSLIVWGEGDRLLAAQQLARLRRALPHAEVSALAGVGHWPQEEAPEQVGALLDQFLPRGSGAQAKLARA